MVRGIASHLSPFNGDVGAWDTNLAVNQASYDYVGSIPIVATHSCNHPLVIKDMNAYYVRDGDI